MEETAQPEKTFVISTGPFIRKDVSVPGIMITVLAALAPATAASLYFFGFRALVHILLAVAFAVGTEALIQTLRKVPVTINDYSAALTGLLLAFNLPPGAPYWISAVGGIFAVAVVKQAFGGLGFNFVNPALAARAFLLAAWPMHMTAAWTMPRGAATMSGITSAVDGVSAATPLNVFKGMISTGMLDRSELRESLWPCFTGQVGGCIGETSAAALLIGAAYLIYKGYIKVVIPAAFVGTTFLLAWIFNGTGSYFTMNALIVPVFHLLSGGLVLGAFFMATDMVTSPITPVGGLLFGAGCGCITMLIRLAGGYPEGVSYSILLMNVAAPLLDRVRLPRKYGVLPKTNENQ